MLGVSSTFLTVDPFSLPEWVDLWLSEKSKIGLFPLFHLDLATLCLVSQPKGQVSPEYLTLVLTGGSQDARASLAFLRSDLIICNDTWLGNIKRGRCNTLNRDC